MPVTVTDVNELRNKVDYDVVCDVIDFIDSKLQNEHFVKNETVYGPGIPCFQFNVTQQLYGSDMEYIEKEYIAAGWDEVIFERNTNSFAIILLSTNIKRL